MANVAAVSEVITEAVQGLENSTTNNIEFGNIMFTLEVFHYQSSQENINAKLQVIRPARSP